MYYYYSLERYKAFICIYLKKKKKTNNNLENKPKDLVGLRKQ